MGRPDNMSSIYFHVEEANRVKKQAQEKRRSRSMKTSSRVAVSMAKIDYSAPMVHNGWLHHKRRHSRVPIYMQVQRKRIQKRMAYLGKEVGKPSWEGSLMNARLNVLKA